MKKLLLSLLIMCVLVLSVVPGVLAVYEGSGLGVTIITEDFEPLVWQCDHRVVYDDGTEPGRISPDGTEMIERINNYAFEGEQIQMKVLVMDKNGIDKVSEVYVSVDGVKEANCDRLSWTPSMTLASCNAQILEEDVTEFDSDLMAYYRCTFTVETPYDPLSEKGMYGPVDITVVAEDVDGEEGVMAEMEHWFLNPGIELDVQGELVFDEVRPGTSSYSGMVTVGNDADAGSGVWMDMFISGTDFYDSENSGAKCPTTNQLSLSAFRYYSASGAYSTHDDSRSDAEGYVPIKYGIGFNNPNPFYNNNEILQAQKVGPYWMANILAPGAEMSLTFRLELPEPCNGDFDTGQIYFWGEAV